MRRRTFFGSAFAGLAATTCGARPARTNAGGIPQRTFGKTGVSVTVIGQAGGRFPLISFEEAKAITLRACDLGINYFDTSIDYWDGRSEEVYGAVLPPFRKHIFLTTKANRRDRAGAEEELNTSLKRLRTDYIDLWQMHALNEKEEVDRIFGPGGAIEAFEAAKKAGKCRFIGFTGHHDPHVHLAMLEAYEKFDSILMPLNIADAHYLSFQDLTLPVAVERGMGIQGMKNFGNAKLMQDFSARECLSYVLSLPVSCTAIGCTTIGQLEDDVRIAQQFKPLAADEMQDLRQRAQHISGPHLEDWKRDTESRAANPSRGTMHG
ncbi:MAG: aldo/keto reductase [Acidobacteria bacterium]|nr:MAG: aldo/keto reductase [Acidobacteriota bacterium]